MASEDILRENRFKLLSEEHNSLISDSKFNRDKHRVMGDNAIFTTYSYYQGKFEIYRLKSNGYIEPLITNVFETHPNDDPLMLLGSCNGLVGVKTNYRDYMLWNPVREEYTMFNENEALKISPSAFGMCYNSSSNEYLAVIVGTLSSRQYRNNITCVQLINFTTNKSKVINGLSEDLGLGLIGAGTVVCGVPHWIKEVFNSDEEWDRRKEIVFFDPNRELFDKMELPSVVIQGNRLLGLGALNSQSELGIVVQDLKNRCYIYNIWVMKEYGNSESWTYQCKIPSLNIQSSYEYVNLIGINPDGEIWIHHMLSHGESEKLKLITYDIFNKRIKNVTFLGSDKTVVNVTTYQPSDISCTIISLDNNVLCD